MNLSVLKKKLFFFLGIITGLFLFFPFIAFAKGVATVLTVIVAVVLVVAAILVPVLAPVIGVSAYGIGTGAAGATLIGAATIGAGALDCTVRGNNNAFFTGCNGGSAGGTGAPQGAPTYTHNECQGLSCVVLSGFGTNQCTVDADCVAKVNLNAPEVVEIPDPINLSWTSFNVNSCVASSDWSGSKPTSGSESLTKPRGTYTFTLTCTGPGGSASDTENVRVIQVPRCSFTANPTSIIPPASSTLSWSCQYADPCSIDQGIGSVNNVSGTKGVRPTKTTTYTLTCSGLDGSRSYQATVNVGFTPRLREVIPR